MAGAGHRGVRFTCDGAEVEVPVEPGESLLSVLRERLGIVSAKDGCSPQGQCGCCTVLVDGAPRVACVTPAERVDGRVVTTVDGLDPAVRDALVEAFVATGGSQCGFCTPGIVVRLAPLLAAGRVGDAALGKALAAHLCRCTGWETVVEAARAAGDACSAGGVAGAPTAGAPTVVPAAAPRRADAAARRATLEGGVPQRVGPEVPLGSGGFADDTAPRDTLVAVPVAPGGAAAPGASVVDVEGGRFVVAESLFEARAHAGAVPGRRTSVGPGPPLPLPDAVPDGVRLATGWVEPAYLEPDASWCVPGGEPATALANGGAFGGKAESRAPRVARDLADRLGRPVRVVYSRDDAVRLGPKRPPVAASARLGGRVVGIDGVVAGPVEPFLAPVAWPWSIEEAATWRAAALPGPATSASLRAVGLAERALLVEGALDAAGADRGALVTGDRAAGVLLDTCVRGLDDALAGARVVLDADGGVRAVDVRVAAGDPLDAVVLRSYAVGAAHMALGWVLTEQLVVDEETGEVLGTTIRSFGIVRAASTPPIDVTIVDDDGPPRARSSDAVFAAVAAATWNAVARHGGERPERLPALGTPASRALRR